MSVGLGTFLSFVGGIIFDGSSLAYLLWHFGPMFKVGRGVSWIDGGQYLHFYELSRTFFELILKQGTVLRQLNILTSFSKEFRFTVYSMVLNRNTNELRQNLTKIQIKY